jgi:tetratricopeptide (TPR) repeat protein
MPLEIKYRRLPAGSPDRLNSHVMSYEQEKGEAMCVHGNRRKLLTCTVMILLIGAAAYSGYWSKGFVAGWRSASRAQEAARKCDEGWKNLSSHKLADAVSAFDEAMRLNPRNAKAVFGRALACQEQGRKDAAIKGYTEAIRLHDETAETAGDIWRVGIGPFDTQVSARIVAAFGGQADPDAVRLGGELAAVYLNRGLLRDLKGKTDEAIEDFTRAIELVPQRADPYRARGTAFLKRGFFDVAFADLTEAVRLDPSSCEAFCQRARACLELGKYAEAVEDSRSAIRLRPNCGDAFCTLASALLSLPTPQLAEAVGRYKEAIRLDKRLAATAPPRLAQACFDWGVSLDKAGRRAEAESAFAEAEKVDSKYAQLRQDYEGQKQPAPVAVAGTGPHTVTTMKPIDPKVADLQSQAAVLLEQRQFDEAIEAFTKILQTNPDCADAWYGRGFAFLEKGFPDTAIEDLDRAIRLDSNPPQANGQDGRPSIVDPDLTARRKAEAAQAYCQRGRAYTMTGEYGRGVQDATEAIRLKPDLAAAYLWRAVAYLKDCKYDRILADLAEAVRLDPNLESPSRTRRAEACRGQGVIHLAARRWDEAIAGLEEAIRLEPGWAKQLDPQLSQAYRERGYERANRGDFDEAVGDLNRALKLDKDDSQTCRLCGLTCCKMARACHDRGLVADEREQWQNAVAYLRGAIRFDPEMEYHLRRPLNDAQHNLAMMSPPTQPTQLGPWR